MTTWLKVLGLLSSLVDIIGTIRAYYANKKLIDGYLAELSALEREEIRKANEIRYTEYGDDELNELWSPSKDR